MSDIAIGASPLAQNPFRTRTIALMLAVGSLGFLGMLVLGAYAPDLRSGQNGGAHALSNGATGYSGLVALAQATGRNPRITRSPDRFDTEDLLVVTPELGATDISAVRRARQVAAVTLRSTRRPSPRHEPGVGAALYPVSLNAARQEEVS